MEPVLVLRMKFEPTLQYLGTKALQAEAESLYLWMKWIVEDSLPFNIVEKPSFRENTANMLEPTSTEIVEKYMHLLGECIVKKISKEIKGIFGIVYDGWSDGAGCHYVALFAVFPSASNECKLSYLSQSIMY